MLKEYIDPQKTRGTNEESVCCAEMDSVCAEYPI